ncbi:MAG: twin-arginine translocase TatA/TatE family subunit [Bacteroidales bacterium]|nr:twin-arginine translocase TatA/TatE family subunit [Bacteroidales bacterium]
MEITVIFAVLLLFFGAKRIPEVARALGKATREFKNARDGVVEELKNNAKSAQDEKKQDEKSVDSDKKS